MWSDGSLLNHIAISYQVLQAAGYHKVIDRAAFPRLAMNTRDIFRMKDQPLVKIFTKAENHIKGRRIVVLEAIIMSHLIEVTVIVDALSAEVVDSVVTRMLR